MEPERLVAEQLSQTFPKVGIIKLPFIVAFRQLRGARWQRRLFGKIWNLTAREKFFIVKCETHKPKLRWLPESWCRLTPSSNCTDLYLYRLHWRDFLP